MFNSDNVSNVSEAKNALVTNKNEVLKITKISNSYLIKQKFNEYRCELNVTVFQYKARNIPLVLPSSPVQNSKKEVSVL